MRNLKLTILGAILPITAFALTVPDNARLRNLNVIKNPGFENGTAGYTASGVTITLVTTGSNKLFDGASARVNFSSSGQYVETNAISIPEGLKGAACSQELYYSGGGTADYKISVYDHTPAEVTGSAVTISAAVSVATKSHVDFTCPSGATMKLRVESLGDPAPINIDGLYLGGALVASSGSTLTERSWGGYHDDNCSWSTSSTSFADPSADSTCTLVELFNINFGTVTSYLSGSDKLPGIVFTPSETGGYYVCSFYTISGASNGDNFSGELSDLSSPITFAEAKINTGDNFRWIGACGIYNATSLASKTIRWRFRSTGGNNVSAGAGADVAMTWSISKIH